MIMCCPGSYPCPSDEQHYRQLLGILITIVVAFVSGFITGKILPLMGRKSEVYDDADEFLYAVYM
ncbi:MAG: hypothetical protein AB9842_04860 [Bacteroidales bacterium]